jgi:hypothetical protein
VKDRFIDSFINFTINSSKLYVNFHIPNSAKCIANSDESTEEIDFGGIMYCRNFV